MSKVKASDQKEANKIRPALTPETRENQLIALAMDLAEKQLREGTATSQVITQFLRLGSTEQKRRMEKLERENELLRAKTEAIEKAESQNEMYAEALRAFGIYRGESRRDDDEDDY